MPVSVSTAILTTKEAHAYVNGRLVWEELMKLYHPEILKPFRQVKRGDCMWMVSVIDKVLLVAQAEGSLIQELSCESDRRKSDG